VSQVAGGFAGIAGVSGFGVVRSGSAFSAFSSGADMAIAIHATIAGATK
jgi:hypothetical protein